MSTVARPDVQGPPPPPRRRGRGWVLVAILAVAGLIGAGVVAVVVAGDNPGPGPADDVVTEGRPAPKTEEQKIVEAVTNYFRVDDEAFEGPDPNHPLYPVYATGPAPQQAVDAVRKAQQQNIATRSPANSITEQRVTVLSINGDRAQISVCSIDDGQIVHADTGKPAYEYPPGHATTSLYAAEMAREGGTWKLWSLKREQRWEGVAGCAVGQA
jgi:hypothetical protein